MADDVSISNGLGGTAVISTDQLDDGSHAQEVKILQSGVTTGARWQIDTDGALVNLGSNNDVTVTSGTLSLSGTATVSVAGTPTVSISGGTTVFSGALSAGTAVIGKVGISANGTAVVDILSLTSGTAMAVGIYDSTGSQLSLAAPIAIAATPSIDAGAYAAGDNLDGNIITFANAVATSGGISHLLSVAIQDKSDSAPDLSVFFLNDSITPQSQNAAFTMTDSDAEKIVAVVHTADGVWEDYIQGRKAFIYPSPPIPITCAATSLYAVVRVNAAYTATATTDIIITPTLLR